MNKKPIILSILVLGLLAVGFASAADYPADDIANMESATGEMLNLADNDTADILSTDDSTDINTIENENNGLDESKTDKVNNTEPITKNELLSTTNDDNLLGAGVVYYVNSSSPDGGTGSIDSPYNNLKDALNVTKDYDTIMIASGTYTGTKNVQLFIDKKLNFEKYGAGEAVFDGRNKNTIWIVRATTININGITFMNGKFHIARYGSGGIYFDKDLVNSNINATFINNRDYAILISGRVTNVNITGNFIGNQRSSGAIYIRNTITHANIVGNFINNSGYHGTIYINHGVNVNITGNFIGNQVDYDKRGIGIIESWGLKNTIIMGNFINNTGDAMIFSRSWAMDFNIIHDSIFINNNANYSIRVNYYGYCDVINCWFGNNATNYNEKPINNTAINLDKWLFLNATANPDKIKINESAAITYNLYSYDVISQEIKEYDVSKRNIQLELSQAQGEINKDTALIGEEILYTFKEGGDGSVTGKYETSSYTINFKDKSVSVTSAEDTSVQYGDSNSKFTTKLTNSKGTPLRANIIININGKNHALKTNSKGQASISTADLKPGEYTATITYKGNSKYYPSNATAKITVNNKLTSILSAEDTAVQYGDSNSKFTAKLTNSNGTPLSANIIININGVDHALKTNFKGQASVSTADLKPGEYTATITYKGNSKYNPSSTTARVIVNNKLTSIITAEDTTVQWGDLNSKLYAKLTHSQGTPLSANIIININGMNYALKTNSKGQANISTADLPEGEYTATITYKGNSKYNPTTTTVRVIVNNKLTSVITAEDIIAPCGDSNSKFIAILTNSKGTPLSANIIININGMNYALKTNSKGEASIATADLPEGEYTATVIYKGNSKYNPSSTTAKVTVNNKSNTVVSADDVVVTYGDKNGKFVATLTNAEGVPLSANIIIGINRVNYALKTNSKGEASISTANLPAGEYTATVTYKGNSKYNPSSTTAKVTVNRLTSCISGVYNSENQEVIGTLTNSEGVPLSANVAVTLNGVKYAMKSDSKGEFRVSTADLAPGSYTAKLVYKGNSKYNPSSTTVNVVIA